MNAAPGPAGAFAQELHQLGELLARQHDALLRGDADALPRLAGQLHARLCALQAGRLRPGTPADHARLDALRRQLVASQALVRARAQEVGRALQALSPEPADTTYQSAGQLRPLARNNHCLARV